MKRNQLAKPDKSPIQAEVVTERDMASAIYIRLGVSDMVERFGLSMPYSDTDSRPVMEADLDLKLIEYAAGLSPLAVRDGELDIPLLRAAHDVVIDDMNRVADKKLGDVHKRRSRLLARLGAPEPPKRTYFAYHDDKFWNEQFVNGYREGKYPQRQIQETDAEYLTKYFANNLHGFALAPYSYLPQAVR